MIKCFLFVMFTLALSLSCSVNHQIFELSPAYSANVPTDLEYIPLILVGKVLTSCAPIGSVHPSRFDGEPKRLFKVRVRVENVLQGTEPAGDTDIYYFVDYGSMGTSLRQATDLYAGNYELFFLERDNGYLRTICDGSRNCVEKVQSGSHPNFLRRPNEPINEAIVNLLLTRGQGVSDAQFISGMWSAGRYGQAEWIKALQRLARGKDNAISAEACRDLDRYAPGDEACQNMSLKK